MVLKIVYWVSTALVAAMYLGSAAFYVSAIPDVQALFVSLGYPAYLVQVLIVVKVAGVAAILLRRPIWLAQLAYAGAFYHLLLAFGAHVGAGDPNFLPAVIGFALLIASWATQNAARKGVAAYAPTRFGIA